MPGKAPFRTLILVAISFALMTALAVSTAAQNSVPPTARQAATMPAFNSRLAHPTASQMPARPPGTPRFSPHRPLDNNILYDNGPVNGNVDAWTINFGYVVTDSLQATSPSNGIQFWAWLSPEDTITNVQVQLGSAPYGSDVFNGFVNLTQSGCTANDYGFDVCLESASFNVTINGNAWVTLQNANVPSGDPVYWDENSGVGCTSPGCPSQAQENTIGTIPSEAFTILSGTTTTSENCNYTPMGFRKIYEFTGADGGLPTGVVLDRAGNIEGTTDLGGSNGFGTAYKLTPEGSSWVLTSLFSFAGGSNGGNPDGSILGPNQILYGRALGGLGNGLVYNLTPQPTACLTALCPWTENVLYRFSTEESYPDISGFDQAGNLYGFASNGGTYGAGFVFQLTPAPGGWTENIIYNFTGGIDGYSPQALVVGIDGNLYVTTSGGGAFGGGTIFQLVPSGNGWTENVLFTFPGYPTGFEPGAVVQDAFGNLYLSYGSNVYNPLGPETAANIMEASQSNGNWSFTTIAQYTPDDYESMASIANLATDDAGNLAVEVYATCLPCYPQQFIYNRVYWKGRWDLGEGEEFVGPMAIRQNNGREDLFAAGWCNAIWERGP